MGYFQLTNPSKKTAFNIRNLGKHPAFQISCTLNILYFKHHTSHIWNIPHPKDPTNNQQTIKQPTFRTSYISNIPHPTLTSHIPSIYHPNDPYPEHPKSQTSYILHISNSKYPISQTDHILHIPNSKHHVSQTCNITNIQHSKYPTSRTSHLLNSHIWNIPNSKHTLS